MSCEMVWYDPDPNKTPIQKITEGAERFRRKFGIYPRKCLVAKACLERLGRGNLPIESPLYGDGIELKPSADLDNDHFLLIY